MDVLYETIERLQTYVVLNEESGGILKTPEHIHKMEKEAFA